VGSIHVRNSAANNFTADRGKSPYLRQNSRFITGIDSAHRLHGTGRISPHRHITYFYLFGNPFHGSA
jgi:hypothetical protein